MQRFGPTELLDCYARGVFPMADSREDESVFLLDPDARGIIPLDNFHISKSLAKAIKRCTWDITINKAFDRVVGLCAEVTSERKETWINHGIQHLYGHLHHMGHAHSVECWDNDELVGGLYGVSLGGAFFGESMFSRRSNASKIALHHLIERLKAGGFILLDTQFITDHLRTLGALEISREAYHARLEVALKIKADFYALEP